MEREFDLVVIGSGSAGTSAATEARKRGLSVAVIDERPFGGTCTLRGCDPKKVLVAAAQALDRAARYNRLGIFENAPALNWAELIRFKRTFTDPVPAERVKLFEDAGIVPIRGRARFTDTRTLSVDGDRLRAKHFVIATGAKEIHVAQGDDQLLTSETFMEQESLPESLVFVGGGYIAFEFAHVAARAGVQVTIVNRGNEPLRGFDRDLVQLMIQASRKLGIVVHVNAEVDRVERTSGGIVVHAHDSDGAQNFEARGGVLAAGRAADLDHLDLDAAGIERTKKGVKVNQHLQSVSNPSVYAAGDCADGGGLPLTPVAGDEGTIVASNIIDGNAQEPNFRGLVTMVYTIPPLGQVGLTEAQARERGLDVEIHAGDMSKWYSTRHLAEDTAFYKMIVDKRTDCIRGAAIFGPNAEEQLNVLALAVQQQLRLPQAADVLYAYPTGSSDLQYLTGKSR
jgi:glutathione reductase (NADPH)